MAKNFKFKQMNVNSCLIFFFFAFFVDGVYLTSPGDNLPTGNLTPSVERISRDANHSGTAALSRKATL